MFWLYQGSQYASILDIWKGLEYDSDIKCARVLNMPRYSCNNIVTKATILDFLSARFVIQAIHN